MPTLAAMGFIAGAYLLGAIPWGIVLGRWIKGVDLRAHGSGATGTTNALRVLGWQVSVAVFLLDFAKGIVPVLFGRYLDLNPWVVAIATVVAVAGHCWSPYIGFKGGKGMATGGGGSITLFPWIALLFPVMAIIIGLTRLVSLASLLAALIATAAILLSASMGWVGWSTAVAVPLMAVIVVIKHTGNIQRLIKGTERRFGEPAVPPTTPPTIAA